MTTYAVVGRPVPRFSVHKVSGTFLYSADVALPGMLWGKVLRSPFPMPASSISTPPEPAVWRESGP